MARNADREEARARNQNLQFCGKKLSRVEGRLPEGQESGHQIRDGENMNAQQEEGGGAIGTLQDHATNCSLSDKHWPYG